MNNSVAAVKFCVFTIFFGALLGQVSDVHAQTAESAPATDSQAQTPGSIQDYVIAGQYETARELLNRNVEGRPDAALHLLLLEGLIRVHRRKYDDAIKIFREILTLEPSFVLARHELATALYLQGEVEAAAYHSDLIRSTEEDETLRQVHENLLRANRRERNYGFTGNFAFLPSTNINGGTSNTELNTGRAVFTINEESREVSGLGVALGGGGFYRHNLGETSTLTLSGNANLRIFPDHNELQDLTLSSSLIFATKIKEFNVNLGPIVSHQWLGGDSNLSRIGGTAGISFHQTQRDLLSLNGSLIRQNYIQNDFQDSFVFSLSGTWQHVFSPDLIASGTLSTSFTRTDDEANRPDLDFNVFALGGSVTKQWQNGLVTRLNSRVTQSYYLDNFTLHNYARADRTFFNEIELSHRRITFRGFIPTISYSFTKNYSNVGFFDRQSHDFNFRLSKKF